MKALLAIEWLKIKYYRTFWILIAFFAVLVLLWNYQIANGMIKMGGAGSNLITQAYQFPDVFSNTAYWASYMIWFLCILIIILTANEYTFRTNRQNIIDGWKRLDFLHAKVGMIIILSLLATAYVFVVGLILGLSNSAAVSDLFSGTSALFYFFIMSLNYLGFALLLTIWIRRSGLAISLFIIYVMMLENILKFTINNIIDTWGNLLPLQASDELLSFSPLKIAQNALMPVSSLSNNTYIIATLVWCAIYYLAARRTLLRSDW